MNHVGIGAPLERGQRYNRSVHEVGSMTTVALRRWTREEYERMVDAGILGPNDKVELIDGEIVTMTPQKSRHATGVQLAAHSTHRDHFVHSIVITRTAAS